MWSLHFTVSGVHTGATRLLSQSKNEGCTCGPRRETSTLNYVWRWIPHWAPLQCTSPGRERFEGVSDITSIYLKTNRLDYLTVSASVRKYNILCFNPQCYVKATRFHTDKLNSSSLTQPEKKNFTLCEKELQCIKQKTSRCQHKQQGTAHNGWEELQCLCLGWLGSRYCWVLS